MEAELFSLTISHNEWAYSRTISDQGISLVAHERWKDNDIMERWSMDRPVYTSIEVLGSFLLAHFTVIVFLSSGPTRNVIILATASSVANLTRRQTGGTLGSRHYPWSLFPCHQHNRFPTIICFRGCNSWFYGMTRSLVEWTPRWDYLQFCLLNPPTNENRFHGDDNIKYHFFGNNSQIITNTIEDSYCRRVSVNL
jgi:hypothetical protein